MKDNKTLKVFGVCKTESLQIFDLQHRKLKIFECFTTVKKSKIFLHTPNTVKHEVFEGFMFEGSSGNFRIAV